MDDRQFNTLLTYIGIIGAAQVGLLTGIIATLLILLDKLA
jgi:hypothetical protein